MKNFAWFEKSYIHMIIWIWIAGRNSKRQSYHWKIILQQADMKSISNNNHEHPQQVSNTMEKYPRLLSWHLLENRCFSVERFIWHLPKYVLKTLQVLSSAIHTAPGLAWQAFWTLAASEYCEHELKCKDCELFSRWG